MKKKTLNAQPASARDGLRRGERSTSNVECRRLNVERWTACPESFSGLNVGR
jgi:hypothetical protein